MANVDFWPKFPPKPIISSEIPKKLLTFENYSKKTFKCAEEFLHVDATQDPASPEVLRVGGGDDEIPRVLVEQNFDQNLIKIRNKCRKYYQK